MMRCAWCFHGMQTCCHYAQLFLFETTVLFLLAFFYSVSFIFFCVFASCSWYLNSHLIRPSLAKKAFSLITICKTCIVVLFFISDVAGHAKTPKSLWSFAWYGFFTHNLCKFAEGDAAGAGRLCLSFLCERLGTQRLLKFELPLQEWGKFRDAVVNLAASSCYVTDPFTDATLPHRCL